MQPRPYTPRERVQALHNRIESTLKDQARHEHQEGVLWGRFWLIMQNPDRSIWELRGAMHAWLLAGNIRIKTGWLLERLRAQIPEARYAASANVTPEEEAEARRRLYILPSKGVGPGHTHYRRPGGRKPGEDAEHRRAYRKMERRYGSYKTRRGE